MKGAAQERYFTNKLLQTNHMQGVFFGGRISTEGCLDDTFSDPKIGEAILIGFF